MENFIHQQNLALFKKRLAEKHSDADEVADGGAGERTTAEKWNSQAALICIKQTAAKSIQARSPILITLGDAPRTPIRSSV